MTRRPLVALALLLPLAALAGGWTDENPTEFHPGRLLTSQVLRSGLKPNFNTPKLAGRTSTTLPPGHPAPHARVSLSGPVLRLRAIALDGHAVEIPVPAGLDLADPLPVPSEPMADLEITLSGPITVLADVPGDGRIQHLLWPERLIVPLDDPERAAEEGEILLDLPAEAAATDDALQDAILALCP